MFKFDLGQDKGIDLGTATVIAYVKGKGIVLREPSVVAVDNTTGEVVAVGQEARRMLGRTPGNIVATRPLREGVISDYTVTEKMLKHFISKICGRFIFAPRIMICIPSRVTEVEKKAVIDAATQAGARKVYLIEEPIAAAIGAGIDIAKPCGNMVVDIGGGTTDIAVISLGGSVVSSSLKVAGDKFDEYIVKYIKKKHNMMIGERTAEDLKVNVGCVYPKIQDTEMDIRGRDLITGLPKTITIHSSEMLEALIEPAMMIVDAVHSVLERTPPELAADISDKGIYMTGGGCLVDGLDKLLQEKTGINVMIAQDTVSCVALGTGKALDNKVAFITLGCKVNQYETNAMCEKFINKGYEVVEKEEKADIYIVNTCTVTNMSDRKSRQMLRRVKEINEKAIIVACGCYAQVAKEELEKIDEIDIVLGNNEKKNIVDYVEKYIKEKTK